MPLDQNWAIANSMVWPPSTANVKLLIEGDENVTTLSHFFGLFKGKTCKEEDNKFSQKMASLIIDAGMS